jgi:hypothetical protein
MKETVKGSSSRFKKKVLARWRWLSARGVGIEQAAEEIGVTVTELRSWMEDGGRSVPLIVPVQVEDEVVSGERGGFIAVLAGVVRVEGLTIADVAELARRLS